MFVLEIKDTIGSAGMGAPVGDGCRQAGVGFLFWLASRIVAQASGRSDDPEWRFSKPLSGSSVPTLKQILTALLQLALSKGPKRKDDQGLVHRGTHPVTNRTVGNRSGLRLARSLVQIGAGYAECYTQPDTLWIDLIP